MYSIELPIFTAGSSATRSLSSMRLLVGVAARPGPSRPSPRADYRALIDRVFASGSLCIFCNKYNGA